MHTASTWIVTVLIMASLLTTACTKEGADSGTSEDALIKLNSESLPEVSEIFQELKELVEYSIDESPIQPPAAEMDHNLLTLYLIGEKIWLHDCTLTTETYWDGQNSAFSYRNQPKPEQYVIVFSQNIDLRYVDQEETRQLEDDKLVMMRNHAIEMRKTSGREGWQTFDDISVVHFPKYDPTNPVYRKFGKNEPKVYKKRSFNLKFGWAHPEDQPDIKEAFGKLASVCQDPDTLEEIQEREAYRKKLIAEDPDIAESLALEKEFIDAPNWIKDLYTYKIVPGSGMAGIQIGDSIEEVITKYGEPDTDAKWKFNKLGGGSEDLRLLLYNWPGTGGGLVLIVDSSNKISNIGSNYLTKHPIIVGLTDRRAGFYEEIKAKLGDVKSKFFTWDPKNPERNFTIYNYSGIGFQVSNNGYIDRIEVPEFKYTTLSKIKKMEIESSKSNKITASQKSIAADLLAAYDNDLDRLNLVADHADYAVLAVAAYGSHDSLEIAEDRGWKPLQTFVDNNMLFGDAVATLFVSEDGQHVIAFRGTKTIGDWITNINGTFSVKELNNIQIEGARKIARENAHLKDLTFVGHSLGGRLAQVARYETNDPAVVFNTAPFGVNELVKIVAGGKKPSAPKASFKSPQDPLSSLFSPKDTEVSNIERVEAGALANLVNGKAYTHSMDVLVQAMLNVDIARESGWISAYLAEK